ncbi:aspartate carbamoyltransferase catalytic subunit [Haloferula luteola]|uniref:Aspartate carbamoyltransferase catalytic subunit n=1 Tax=Haloferula luteola TaxID=595692 RepID=A0A840VH82_9BACT|nr:aspartate carbamoyltransferase [Haloferula luteola]MBB5353179.1 aspartate carbamoyltransferase catalytic subunit [Haloferula luteola]
MSDAFTPNPVTPYLKPPRGSEATRPEPRSLFESSPPDLKVLAELSGQNVLYSRQFSFQQVAELCKLAAFLEQVEIWPYHPLDGKIVTTAFFEASTRTRTSFESAVHRLAGKIISIPDGSITGAKKGESLQDIGEMFNAYCDCVVMRHTETDAPKRILQNLRVPLINAGNGSGEHPTQALADWYALLKWKPRLAAPFETGDRRLQMGILGTPGSMRAVKSFLLMSLLFADHIEKVTVISEMADPFGKDVTESLNRADIEYEVTNDIRESLPKLDVIYMNSIAFLGDSYKALDARYKLDAESPLKKDAVILHPLARLDELDTSLDKTPHNLYFSQAHGAVFVRQALLLAVLGRLDRLPEFS